MAQLRWMKSALEDLTDIVRYIQRDSPRYATLFKERILEFAKHIESMPYMGEKSPNLMMIWHVKFSIRNIVLYTELMEISLKFWRLFMAGDYSGNRMNQRYEKESNSNFQS